MEKILTTHSANISGSMKINNYRIERSSIKRQGVIKHFFKNEKYSKCHLIYHILTHVVHMQCKVLTFCDVFAGDMQCSHIKRFICVFSQPLNSHEGILCKIYIPVQQTFPYLLNFSNVRKKHSNLLLKRCVAQVYI